MRQGALTRYLSPATLTPRHESMVTTPASLLDKETRQSSQRT
jgi:hypothetical protein